MRRQAVLGVSPLANATLGAGKIPITEENWNETFHVPLVATTDSIPGGGISDVALGFRLKAGLRFHNITRVPVSRLFYLYIYHQGLQRPMFNFKVGCA